MTKKQAATAPASTARARKPRTAKVGNSGGNSGMRPQPHGGALLPGGQPGNKGGGGPTNEIRQLARAGYRKAVPRLIRIALGTETRRCLSDKGKPVQVQPTLKESIMAAAELSKIGVGTKIEMDTPTTPIVFGVLVCPEIAEGEA